MSDNSFVCFVKLIFLAAKGSDIISESKRLFAVCAVLRQVACDFRTCGKVKIGFFIFRFIIDYDFSPAYDGFRQFFRDFGGFARASAFEA